MSYITEQMRKELADHVLVEHDEPTYCMQRLGTSVFESSGARTIVRIGEFADRLCVAGDIRLGANNYGLVSAPGYGIYWFADDLSEAYLCEKFFRKEWRWDASVEAIRWLIKFDEDADEDGWWTRHATELSAYLADPKWRYDDTPNEWEFREKMASLGFDSEVGDPLGCDYPRKQAGWLCAIQQRFRELYCIRSDFSEMKT